MELERCWSCVGEAGKDYQYRDRMSTDSSETSPGNESLLDGSLWSLISCLIVEAERVCILTRSRVWSELFGR